MPLKFQRGILQLEVSFKIVHMESSFVYESCVIISKAVCDSL
jgi:hypothetical protein